MHLVAVAGDNVTVSCVVVGDPEPRVHWTRDSSTSSVLQVPTVKRRYESDTTSPDAEERLLPWRLVSWLPRGSWPELSRKSSSSKSSRTNFPVLVVVFEPQIIDNNAFEDCRTFFEFLVRIVFRFTIVSQLQTVILSFNVETLWKLWHLFLTLSLSSHGKV